MTGRAYFADHPKSVTDEDWNAAILAIEAQARAEVTDDMTTAYMVGYEAGKAAARAPLDVERLAHALHMLHVPGWFNGHRSSDLDLAAAIAREYAALEEPTPPRKPAWVGVPDANGDIHCSRLAPQRCVWVEGHYGGCATP
jgi:hypothetical protein